MFGDIIPAQMMEPPEPIEETAVVEIDLVRHNGFVFYNRREDGRSVVTGQRIPLTRAQTIYEANQANAWQRVKGEVSFAATSAEWSWTTRITL